MSIKKYPKISVVTPSYNQAQFIKATIDSVLSQDYPNLEYFVIDGGSTDGTIKILKSYGNKIRWVSEKDKGQTDAINKGLRMATGEVLAYLNSDDIYMPDTLNKVAKYFSEHPHTHWLTGGYNIINGNGSVHPHQGLVTSYKSFLLENHRSWLLKSCNSYIPQPSTFWSREAYNKIGEFDTNLRYTMDYDYWLRLTEKYELVYLREPLSCFRRHGESKSDTSTTKQFNEEFKVARSHRASALELTIHKLHSLVTSTMYGLYRK